MPDLDTKLTTLESLASLLDAGAQVLIARVDGKLRIATARQIDDSDVCNLLPNMTLISGLDPDGEYQIECSEAATLEEVLRDACVLNGVETP